MIAKSIYIVQSKIIGLGEKPFLEKNRVRSAFHSMFLNEHCFTDLHTLFYEDNRPVPLPSIPFLKGLGQICLKARSVNLRAKIEDRKVGHIITGRKKYWKHDAKLEPISDFYFDEDDFRFQKGEIFGIDPLLEDERMNFLYFELHKPIFIKAIANQTTMAQGKIFIHIFPSGFIYLFVAISLNINKIGNIDDLRKAFKEARPGSDGDWIWNSRLGTDRLKKLCERVQELTVNSILTPPSNIRDSTWRSFTKIVNPDKNIDFPKIFIRGAYDTLSVNHLPGEGEHRFDKLISSNQGFFLILPDVKKRRDLLRLFWKFGKILEYICFMDFVYKDYVGYLKRETMRLKEYRFQFSSKIQNDDFFRLTVYDQKMVKFVQALANHIHTTTGFYRRVFSSYWNGIDFGEHKESFKRTVEEWEGEVEKWDNTFIAAYKKLISPLRALFGLVNK